MQRLIQFYRTPTFASGRGLRIGRITVSGVRTPFSGDIFIEQHQGKHAEGNWDYQGRSGSTFQPSVASRSELALFKVIITKVFWTHAFQSETGVDKYFEFPFITNMAKKGSDNSPGVHVQASYQAGFFQFHCYPDPNALSKPRVTVGRDEFAQIVQSVQEV